MCGGVPSTARPGHAGFLFLVVAGKKGEDVELDTGTGSAMGFLGLGGLGESPSRVRTWDVDPDY